MNEKRPVASASIVKTYFQRAPVTSAIVLACVIAFLGEAVGARGYNVISGSGSGLSPLLELGVLFQPAVADGEWWRLITSGFLHFGVIHLLLNMYALVYVGLFIEPLYGRWRYAAIYAVSLLAGSVLADLVQGPDAISAGASGAIMGLFGAMAIVGLRYRIARTYLRSALFPIGATLLYGLVNPEISTGAHVGGLIGGAAAAAIVSLPPTVVKRIQAVQVQAALQAQAALAARSAEARADSAGPVAPEALEASAARPEPAEALRPGWRRSALAVVLGGVGVGLLGAAAYSVVGGAALGAWQPLGAVAGLVLLAWAHDLRQPRSPASRR